MSTLIALLLLLPAQLDAPAEESPEVLVKRIRETLGRIDEKLLETSEERDVRAGLAEVREQHLQVIRDIEALIRQQKYRQGGSGGSGGEPSGSPSGGPQGQPSPRESDGASAPRDGEQGAQPPAGQEQEQQGGGEEEQPAGADGQRPEGGQADDDSAGRNEAASGPPPEDPLEPVTREDTDERWGLLPPKLQERLMNLHVDDVPERYRTWLEAYVRSMHALEQRDRGR